LTEYRVGYFKPSQIRGVDCKIPQSFSEGNDPRHCKKVKRKDVFNFFMFPWSNPGDFDFTIAIFGDLGLKKPGANVSYKVNNLFIICLDNKFGHHYVSKVALGTNNTNNNMNP